MATSLWELSLLEAHYHPTVSERAAQTAAGQGTQLLPLEVLSQFDTSNGGFNPAISRPKPHSFDQVMKNAPNSKCYLNVTKKSPMEDLISMDDSDSEEIGNLFGDYFQKEKDFSSNLEAENLKQQLAHYQLILKKYLEFRS
eukprot:CAMPEP_0117053912 /NCGR_PEP_ID=MMETSP0472-20121206/37321_1 /TAXON_ID=693140 ORGANISM="Tiarina fusus, Strain LIS" /NCGR_SAMPLE_ID=MMETSP0472 /ASSEMBLY_ACC=CAM_ASM_000603 /LENGTH=140 /DNA_ID=CAMNT_0004769213 /DNA_START=169 /DNA_END=591 /DNA_ORIENTATION=-